MKTNKEQLSFLSDDLRLAAYRDLVAGTSHLWSKGKMQKGKVEPLLKRFVEIAKKDPLFMAHLTSYLIKNSDSKDLKVIATYANSLSDADGLPFYPGSKLNKPNLRTVSQAAVQELDPKLVHRIASLGRMKVSVDGGTEASHFPRSLKTAIKKYLKLRAANTKAMAASGFKETFKNLYRVANIKPEEAVYNALGWAQGNKETGVTKPEKLKLFDFSGKSDVEVAKEIQDKNLPALSVISALDRQISPVIAAALLETCSGDQALILRKTWDSQGILKHKEVQDLFASKLKTAKSLDRVEKINTEIDEAVKSIMKETKSEKQKEIAGDLGSVFLHIDMSGSMDRAISVAKETASLFAECVQNPEENFHWGLFNSKGTVLNKPEGFTKDHFHKALYGVRAGGGTNCFALYGEARKVKAKYDVYFTDQDSNSHPSNPLSGKEKPEGCVIVNFGSRFNTDVQDEYIKEGIPVAILDPKALMESAGVAQMIRHALRGQNSIIEDIMSTPLLKLPQWWYSI